MAISGKRAKKSKRSLATPFDLSDIVRTKRSIERLLLRDPNVVGVSVGARHIDSSPTKERAICVFVRVKRPRVHLHGSLIPKHIPLVLPSGESHERLVVKTDVQETGSFYAARIPIGSRILINRLFRGAATLVFRSSKSDEGIVISCAHVLDPTGLGNGVISIAGQSASGCHTHPFLRGEASAQAANNLDAGYCIIPAAVGAPPLQTSDGLTISSISDFAPTVGTVLTADLSVSGKTTGTVTTHADLRCSYLLNQGDFGDDTTVTNAYILSVAAQHGDSGSLVYQKTNDPNEVQAVGMIVATNQLEAGGLSGNVPYSIFHPLYDVFAKFSLSISEVMF
jgi:hypothetical protein